MTAGSEGRNLAARSSGADALAGMVAACDPLIASPERRARVLARVLERPRRRRSLIGLVVRLAGQALQRAR